MSEEEARKIRKQFSILLVAVIIIVALGTVVFHYVEKFDWIDALYFSVVALTTVGFGDLTPETTAGKLLVILYLLIGIAIVGAFLNILIKGQAAKRVIKEIEEREKDGQKKA